MKKLIISGFLALAALIGSHTESRADFPGFFQRLQVGYTFVSNSAQSEARDFFPILGIDTSYTHTIKTKGGFGATIGSSIPLARLGKVSMLTLGVDYMYNMMLWDSNVPRYGFGPIGDAGGFNFSGATVQMALPVGLDIKFGADALAVKNHRFCATIGAGAYPSYAMTSLDYDYEIDPQFSITPYAKLEVGFFAGICMKLRVITAIGTFNYMDVSSDNPIVGKSKTTLTGTSSTTISLLFMPFSFSWKKTEWWNSF